MATAAMNVPAAHSAIERPMPPKVVSRFPATVRPTTDPTTLANAQASLSQIDNAISQVNTAIGVIGSLQSRIEVATENVRTTIQNFSAAESTIRDLDMAAEMTTFTKNQVLSQAGTAMLAQANAAGQSILSLLRG